LTVDQAKELCGLPDDISAFKEGFEERPDAPKRLEGLNTLKDRREY
jgi:hypothetical protein